MRLHSYDSGARLTQTVDSLTYPGLSTQYDFVRQQSFDAAGNVEWRGEHEHETSGEWYDHLRSYYGADDKLALANRHIGISAVSDDSRAGTRGVWEMSRYDALGRRVQTHSVRGSGCPGTETECASYLERTVWDGDQLLYEIRAPESTPTGDTPAGGTYHAFGRVGYLHGGGLDASLAITRLDLSGQPAEVTVAPHADWQGAFVGGSLMNGTSQAPCTGASGCPLIDWPGGTMTTDGEGDATLREAYTTARNLGRKQGAERAIIAGGRRTTGVRPGHVPRPIILETMR